MTTKAEQQWMSDIVRLGCVVCFLQGYPRTPAVVHHILKSGRRQSHLETIGLCDPGHHQSSMSELKISRHPWKVKFEQAYGTEEFLLESARTLVARMRQLEKL